MKPAAATIPVGPPCAQDSHILELVAYKMGAIVRCEFASKSNASMTIFAFDTGQALSEHTAAFDILAQVLEGEAELSIAGKAHYLHDGEMILLPAHQAHTVRAITRFKMKHTIVGNPHSTCRSHFST